MASSEADIQALIDAIDTAINAKLTTPFADLVDYEVAGRLRIDKTATLKELRELRAQLVEERDRTPAEATRVFLEPGSGVQGSREDLNPY